MTIKRTFQFLCITLLLIIVQACNSKKEPYQYVSFCPKVPEICRDSEGTKSACTVGRVFKGMVKNQAECTYLKIPSVVKIFVSLDHATINNLPIQVVYPKSKALLKKYGYDYVPDMSLSNGHKAIILNYIESFPKVPMTKYANLDAYIKYESKTYVEMFPGFPDSLGSKGSEMRYAFDMSVVKKDKTAVVQCRETSSHELNLNNVKPFCRVTALVAKNILLTHYIPFELVPHFEELHHSYDKLFSSFVVNSETIRN